MYAPRFTITNSIVRSVGRIEASKEVIENAPLVPDYVKEFKSDAIVRTVYHGTQIEGNDLTLFQTKQVLEGQAVTALERDIQEVINYRNVVSLLDELSAKRAGYELEDLLEIHKFTVDKIIDPSRAGVLRTTQVVIREEGTGKVIFTPPPAVEVPYLINDFLSWLNLLESKDIHPVIRAGIAHYVLVTIHPFVEGNGRTVRAFSTLVMIKEGYDVKRFFSIEEHLDRDLAAYYEAFFKVDSQGGEISTRDLTPWLEYFVEVVAIELNKIKEKVRRLSVDSRMRLKIGEQVALSARQMKLIEYLSEHGKAMMRDLKDILPMISEDTILRDLKDLLNKNIIEKEGSTKAARYVLKH